MNELVQNDPLVQITREGAITRITLRRPRALNALTTDMVLAVRSGVQGAALDGSRAIWLDGAGDRGFCGGGDVKAMSAGGGETSRDFLWHEYRADHAIATSELPVVGVMDGITMGGGIGLTGHASIRVVTERSRLAMPETRIGIVPDVGANAIFATSPGRLGDLLAATSASMNAADAIAMGFADHFLPSAQLDALRLRIAAGEHPRDAVAAFAEDPGASPLLADREWCDEVFSAALGDAETTLADPLAATIRLLAALERSDVERAREVGAQIRAVCPTAVVVALARNAAARLAQQSVEDALREDFRVLPRLIARPDFAEGIRAQLIDKDGAPKWGPASVEALDSAEVRRILDPELTEEEIPLEFSNAASPSLTRNPQLAE